MTDEFDDETTSQHVPHMPDAPDGGPDDEEGGMEGDQAPATATSTAATTAAGPALAARAPRGPRPGWHSVLDYVGAGSPKENFGTGSAKLASSYVAPLVAAARPYRTFDQESQADAFKMFGSLLPTSGSYGRTTMRQRFANGDVLIMPWFSIDAYATFHARTTQEQQDSPLRPTSVQWRPSNPRTDRKTNREVKYESLAGSVTPIGIHPSTPKDWFLDAPRVLIAEGLLKGDAALTGLLLASGISADALAYTGGGPEAARARLTALMEKVPFEQRVAIVTIVGSGTWRNNTEWLSVPTKGREVWIGLDADVDSNPAVFKQAQDMWDMLRYKRKAIPLLLAPKVTGEAAKDETLAKAGIDDYLAKIGTWEDLVAGLRSELPDSPISADADEADTYRMNEDGTVLQHCVPLKDPATEKVVGGTWTDHLPIGGRIISFGGTRDTTAEEVRSGKFDPSVPYDADSEDVVIEIAWADENGGIVRHHIEGPSKILNYAPDQWDSHGARIPNAILAHPEWPIDRKEGRNWLGGMKSHRRDDQRDITRWDCMGWIPTEAGIPVYIVGEQIVADNEEHIQDVHRGVTRAELNSAHRFGVGDRVPGSFDDQGYRDVVAAQITELLETFVQARPWTDRGKAAAVIGAGLRPVMPTPNAPKVSCLLVGPRRGGKSWTAQGMMSFWAAEGSPWTSLPGSVKDSLASTEIALSRTPIWVCDDLAPATSRRQAEQEQDTVGTIIRNVFNGQARGRANASMKMRKQHLPRALFVVTAENDLTVDSVQDRCVVIDIAKGDLNQEHYPTDAVDALAKRGVPAKVTQAMIRWFQWQAANNVDGWAGVVADVENMFESEFRISKSIFSRALGGSSSSDRHATIANDLVVPLACLAEMARQVGVDDRLVDLIEAQSDSMIADLRSLVARNNKSANARTPGAMLIEAISQSLEARACHLTNPEAPDEAPPIAHERGGLNLVSALGWSTVDAGMYRPGGQRIGHIRQAPNGRWVAYLAYNIAFDAAKKTFPTMIREGSSHRTAWAAVKSDGFVVSQLVEEGATRRQTVGGDTKRYVPIDVAVLIDPTCVDEVNRIWEASTIVDAKGHKHLRAV